MSESESTDITKVIEDYCSANKIKTWKDFAKEVVATGQSRVTPTISRKVEIGSVTVRGFSEAFTGVNLTQNVFSELFNVLAVVTNFGGPYTFTIDTGLHTIVETSADVMRKDIDALKKEINGIEIDASAFELVGESPSATG